MDALVAYGTDSEEEQEEEAHRTKHGEAEQQTAQDEQREVAEAQHGDDFGGDKMEPGPSSQLVEPGPPRRQSDMYEDSDEDAQPLENRSGGSSAEEGEVEIDAMVEEGRELLMSGAKHTDVEAGGGGSTPGPGYTPRSVIDEAMEIEEPKNAIQHRDLPPSPFGACDPELEQKFAVFFEKKEQGVNMNAVIKQRKDYKNPSLYEALRDTYEIDEKGTNFPANVYDPNGFRPDDFYDALGDYQSSQEARRKKLAQTHNQEHKRPASFPTAGGGSDAKHSAAQRRSRFEGK